jgi:hypothetical protein
MASDKEPDKLPVAGLPPKSFFDAKRAIKRELIALPFEEKIRRVIEMQKMEKLLKGDKGREIFVWKL